MTETPYRFFYWGPFLTHFKLSKETTTALLKKANKKNDYGSTLAGFIKGQYKYDEKFFLKQLKPYFFSYINGVTKHWNWRPVPKDIQIKNAWINHMKAGEFNPPHIHSGDLTCVAFLKMPKDMKKENKNFSGVSGGPGCLEFRFGEACGYSFRTSHFFLPEEGDFFIFPAKLQHYVCPFYSRGERISMSANFNLIY